MQYLIRSSIQKGGIQYGAQIHKMAAIIEQQFHVQNHWHTAVLQNYMLMLWKTLLSLLNYSVNIFKVFNIYIWPQC